MRARSVNARFGALRSVLRRETDAAHRRLDDCLHPLALGDDEVYGQFLAVQYAARKGMEGQLSPLPAVSGVIAEDLSELGIPLPAPIRFSLPDGGLVGAQWALAGSSLGNRQVFGERSRMGRKHAMRFLEDASGAHFFRSLLPILGEEHWLVEEARAVRGALAVFNSFLTAAAWPVMSEAA